MMLLIDIPKLKWNGKWIDGVNRWRNVWCDIGSFELVRLVRQSQGLWCLLLFGRPENTSQSIAFIGEKKAGGISLLVDKPIDYISH
jgi:hypothetical protein